jgi:hypothetical protein
VADIEVKESKEWGGCSMSASLFDYLNDSVIFTAANHIPEGKNKRKKHK